MEYSPFQKKHLSFAGTRSQMNTTLYITKIDQEKGKIEQVCIWNHMTTGFIKYTLIYVISMEFPPLSRRRSSSQNIPSGEEQGETAVVTG